MKEAIGSSLLFKLVFAFIVIYMGLLAVGINYAITFRHKNQIVSLLEQYEGYEGAKTYISNYINAVGYYGGKYRTKIAGSGANADLPCLNDTNLGYCISEIKTTRGSYYKVTTIMKFNFPIIGDMFQSRVTGETSVVYDLRNM